MIVDFRNGFLEFFWGYLSVQFGGKFIAKRIVHTKAGRIGQNDTYIVMSPLPRIIIGSGLVIGTYASGISYITISRSTIGRKCYLCTHQQLLKRTTPTLRKCHRVYSRAKQRMQQLILTLEYFNQTVFVESSDSHFNLYSSVTERSYFYRIGVSKTEWKFCFGEDLFITDKAHM